MKDNASFEKHLEAIKSGHVDRSNIIGMRKGLNAYERAYRGYSIGRTSGVPSEGQVKRLEEYLGLALPIVVGDLEATGKALLKSKRYAKQLAPYADIVADVQHFKFCGFDYIGRDGDKVTPVYRAFDSRGSSFPFRNIPWQSGGRGPEIVSSNYW